MLGLKKRVGWRKDTYAQWSGRRGEQLEKQCEVCQKHFTVTPFYEASRYCSVECRIIARKGVSNINHPHYCKVECTCLQCGGIFLANKARVEAGNGKLCSRSCLGSYSCAIQAQNQGPTSIELKVSEWLEELGVFYIEQHAIGRWCVDFYLPDYNLVLECDGDYWHSLPEVVVRDAKKNEDLLKMKYNLLRLTETQIKAGNASLITDYLD